MTEYNEKIEHLKEIRSNAEIEKLWQEFWLPIVTHNGKVELDLIKAELFDFHKVCTNLPSVLMVATRDRVSKINTDPDVVIDLIEKYLEDEYQRGYDDAVEEHGIPEPLSIRIEE